MASDLLRRQYDEMVSENARLTALVSEQAREIERLRARAERSEAVLRNLADAAAPFAKRMKQAVEHQEKWRADHPGQMAPLLNSEPIPSHWNYTPMVGEARRLVAALAAASEGLPSPSPLASYPVTLEVVSVEQGKPLPPDDAASEEE